MQRKEIQRGDLFYYDFGKREGSVQSGCLLYTSDAADE